MDAVVGALIAAVVGGPIGYILGTRQARFERLYEQRALVIARLSELLFVLESDLVDRSSPYKLGKTDRFVMDSDLTDWSSPFHIDPLDRDEQRKKTAATWQELAVYYRSNAVWLDRATCDTIDSFLKTTLSLTQDYENSLESFENSLDERGHPPSPRSEAEVRDAALRLINAIPPLRRDLEEDFRSILYPPPWYEAPLRFLERIQARNRQTSESVPDPANGRPGDSERPQG
jgi:hypothetical protein